MQKETKNHTPTLTNAQQLLIMDQVKSNNMSIDKALKYARQLSSEGQDSSIEMRKKTKSPDILESEEVYNFAVIVYLNGFRQIGSACCLQIDFVLSVIRILAKCRVKWEIPFELIKEFSNKANSNQLKIPTVNGPLKFTANSEDKDYIFELLGMIVLDNECKKYDKMENKELDRQSMNCVFRNRNILKEGILEKRIDANMLLWLERYVVVKEGEFSYSKIENKENSYLVQMWTDSMNISSSSDSEFSVTHNNRQYIFRVKNKNPVNAKAERDSWIKAFRQATARKNIKTEWMKNVRFSLNTIEEETGRNSNESKMSSSPPVDYTDGAFPFKMSSIKENDILNVSQERHDDTRWQKMEPQPLQQAQSPVSPSRPMLSPVSPGRRIPLIPSPVSPGRRIPPPVTPTILQPPPPPPLPSKTFYQKEIKVHSVKKLKHFPVPYLSRNLLITSVWHKLQDLTPNIKQNLLQEKFAVKPDEKILNTAATNSEKIYMNEKKAQNVMILMRGRFLESIKNISSALVSLEENDFVNLDDIRTLQKYQPDADEIEMYQRLMIEGVEFKHVDNCMLKLSLIPCLRDRLELIHTIWTFNEENAEFLKSVRLASTLCEEILHSKRLVKVLAYILAIFNYLNTSGDRTSHPMSGFDLNYLSNLSSMRGVGNFSILKALKCHLKDDEDSSLQEFPEDLKALLQCEPFSIKSLNVTLEVWKQTMENIKTLVTSIEKRMKNPSQNDINFFQDIKAFLLRKMKEHKEIMYTSSQIQMTFKKILKKFALGPQTSSEKLFENLQQFIRDYINT